MNPPDPNPTDDFDPTLPETFTSAHEQHARLRASCPVAHTSAFRGCWALFRYQDILEALRRHDTFITSVQNVVPKVAFTGRRPPLHFDPPEHTPYRRALNPFFAEPRMRALEPAVRRIVRELLDPLVQARGGEVCSDFTRKLPGYVFAEFFNLSVAQAMEIKDASAVFNRAVQSGDDGLIRETSLRLYDLARGIIADRKASPRDPELDVTSALLQAADLEGNPLPEDMVLGTIRQLIVVGMIAPSVLIPCIMVHLARDQTLQEQLRQERSLVPAALEEFLRLYTPYRGFARTPNRDVVIGGRLIRKDEPIALVYSSANRDESVFPNPDTFMLHRPNIQQHIAFGGGPHRCVGMPLARLMLRVVLEELLAAARITGVSGDLTMTRWPEWGVLFASILMEPLDSKGRP
jgi:cytochrome P450